MKCIVPFVLSAGVGLADCPPPADISGEMKDLFEQVRAAKNDLAARDISGQMWQVWLRAPNAQAQEILNEGMRRRESFDFLGARTSFDRLVDYCPGYAEGFNQRAFVHFLTQNYELALQDLDEALSRNPDHVGAQSGRALTLMELGRKDDARIQLNEALENNPWLSERFLLEPGGRLALEGQDI
ncbi:MAG: tetratricopeptide repeat protein [Pseudomonadota bacterium]